MTKDEIVDYVLNSPENTNPNVLKGMLNQLDNSDDSKIPIIYQENDTIKFYFSANEGEFEATFYICEDISDNITQIFFESPVGKGIFRLVTKEGKILLLPVNSTHSYHDSQLCLIQEKEVWVFGDGLFVIKNSNGVVPGKAKIPK